MDFNIFQTFYRAAPRFQKQGVEWVQKVNGKVVAAFTRAEFKRELKLIAKSL